MPYTQGMDDTAPTGLRYVIYARKSTEDSEKQIRSIDDQLADCRRLAQEYGLNVVDEIDERKSAKTPGNRPKFTQLMRDIADKKVDGIIAWHPDRLARNMVEAGRLIHRLDTGVIKDLRFKTFQFSNANGKMMLGMLFVFAKHYSDDLKTKVDRGMQNNFKEGKSSGSPKHGYIRDDSGLYRPDERNFELIREAWQKRANGASLMDIVHFLAERQYTKYSKKLGEYVPHRITKSSVGAMFGDTFYYGLLNQKSQTVDLRELYDFVPVVDEAAFYQIQSLAGSMTRRTAKNRFVFLPLRYKLFCSVCGETRPMTVGRPANKAGTHYLRYWCANKKCTRSPNKTIRGKVIFDQLADIIEERLTNLPDSAYARYLEEVKELSANQKVKLRGEISAARAILKGHKTKEAELSLSLGRANSSRVTDSINGHLANLAADIERQEMLVKRHQERLAKSELPALTPEEFAERVRKMPAKFKKATGVQKDMILQNLFLNIHVGHEKITNYLWCEPFATLLEVSVLQNGRGDRT